MKSDKMVNIKAGGSEVKLDPETIRIVSDSFQIHSQDQTVEQPLLSVSPDGVSIGSHELDAGSSLGVTVSGAAKASLLHSRPDSDFKLRGPSDHLVVIAEEGVSLQAGFPARIEVSASDEISLSSEQVSVSNLTKDKMASIVYVQ